MPVLRQVSFGALVLLDDSQRTSFGDLSSLAESLANRGLINPITVDENNRVLAGRRRFLAIQGMTSQQLQRFWAHYPDGAIPVQSFSDMSQDEKELIELDENIQRKNITWKEQVRATLRIWRLCQKLEPDITISAASARFGMGHKEFAKAITLGKELEEDPISYEHHATLSSAYLFYTRKKERLQQATSESVEDFLSAVFSEDPEPLLATAAAVPSLSEVATAIPAAAASAEEIPEISLPETCPIKQLDAIEAFQTYKGSKFNFLHIDFPYGAYTDVTPGGINSISKNLKQSSYEDTEAAFSKLLSALLNYGIHQVVADSAHIMFWFPFKHYASVSSAFQDCGFRVHPTPLIWHKSDNSGILADPQRTPRTICEQAFLISRGDRKIVSAVANVFSGPSVPTVARRHISQKSITMLKHFFRLFVDGSSRVLDPTCGSGSALVALKDFSYEAIEGWELSDYNYQEAREFWSTSAH